MSAASYYTIPTFALVVPIGEAAIRAAFLSAHFAAAEIASLAACAAQTGAGEAAAYTCLENALATRLAAGLLAAVDAPTVRVQTRQPLIHLAKHHYAPPVAVLLDPALTPPAKLLKEGFKVVLDLSSVAPDSVQLERVPPASDRRADPGPFDLIGDLHGCLPELETLLARLDWARDAAGVYAHPAGRKLVFLGDLGDRGPDTPGVLRLVLDVLDAGRGYWVPGNHDAKLYRYLEGRQVQVGQGLRHTLEQIDALPRSERAQLLARFKTRFAALDSHVVLDGEALVAAHGGILERMIGRDSPAVLAFTLYGMTTGEKDAHGYPVRLDWAADYKGRALIVYGHTPAPTPRFVNNTINIDQGAVFGGALTALRYPEREIVSVPARRAYYPRPHGAP